MTVSELVLSTLLPALLVWGVVIYNRLVKDRHLVFAAWSDIDVQLKRRHDLIPKLVAVVQSYTGYEAELLTEISRLRASSEEIQQPLPRAELESRLGDRLQMMRLRAEAYPELKASGPFLGLMQEISQVEEQLQYARRFYNGAVRGFNVRLQSFPDLLLARLLAFHPADYFELASSAESAPPELRS